MSIVKYGRHNVAMGGPPNIATQILSPSVNVAGMVIRTLSLNLVAAGSIVLFTGPTAPTTFTDDFMAFRLDTTTTRDSATLPYELELPAGYGLWIWPIISVGAGGIIMSYDLYTA